MSDRRFSGFDVEVVADAVRQPPLHDIRMVVRRRQRRRTTTALGAVVAAALVGLATIPLAVTRSAERTAPGLASSPPERVISQIFFAGRGRVVGVAEAEDCVISFGYTDDFGRSWSDFRTFSDDAVCRTDAEGRTESDVRYHPLGPRTYLVTVDGRSYLSQDAGRTWRDAESAVTVVDSFPIEADPVACESGCMGLSQPMAVDPRTGEAFRLAGKSPSKYPLNSMYESDDGTLWATYWPGDATPVVARSIDRGATWQASMGPERTIGVVGQSRDVAYLLAEPPRSGGTPIRNGPSRLLRTTDGGKSWHDIHTDLPSSDKVRSFTIGSNDSLIVVDQDLAQVFAWVSRDGGRHFTKQPGPSADGAIGAAPGRAWVAGRPAHVTTDGVTWSPLPLP